MLATVTLNPNGQDVTVDPVANYVGPVDFTYTITDPQGLKDTANVTVDVGGVNDAPEARPDVGNTNEDTSLVVNAANGVIQSGLSADGKDTDIDGDSLSVSAVAFGNVVGTVGQALQGKYGALTLNADGSYSFVPNSTANALDDGETGQDVFTYTVTDPGGKTSTTSLTINVTGRNDGPVAIDDSGKTDEDKPVTLNLIANDKDDDGEKLTITQINGQNVSSGQVVPVNDGKGTKIGDLLINGDGTVTFTPVQDYNGPVDFKYTVSDGTATDEGAVHIDVGAGNDAPTARDDLVNGQEDKTVTFDPVTPNDTDPDKDPLTITQVAGKPISVGNPVTVPEGKVELNPDGTLSFTPNKDFNGPVTVTYTISDGNGGTSTANINLDIKAVNDNPDAVNDTKAVTEDTPATGNVLDNDTDVDKDKLSVTGFTIDTNGDGTPESFNPGQKASLVNAAGKPIGDLTINADGSFTFNPAKDYFGPVPVATYSITDGQGGEDSATLTLGDVKPVADTPEGTDATKTTAEDTAYGVTAADFGFKDVDGDTFAAVRIDTLATNGVLKLNGVDVTLGQEISIADINAGKLQFVPDANENGAPYGSFTFSVKDSSGAFDLVPNTLTLNVTAQADTPTGADITKTTNEDTPYVIGKADFGFADVDGDTFKAVRVDTLPTNGTLTLNGVLVTAGQIITVADLDAGKLRFVPDADENGTPYGNFTFSVQDSTNAFDAAPNTFTLNVTSVADTPEGADATRTTKESTPYTVQANDFGFSDADGDTFAAVRIDTLATNGVLKLNGAAVTLGQEISIADINAGKLQFVPDANENGSPYASFTFSVKDSSGAFDLAPNTLTFNVTDVANTPDGTDVTKTTTEDTSYTIAKADFGFKDADAGDSLKAVRIDTLPNNGSLTLNGVLVTAGQIISSADIEAGKLKFVPDANENGTPYGSFTFSVQDSSDLFDTAPNTFTLNVTPVADTPEGTDATKTTAEDTAYGVTAADFGFKDVDGDTFAAVRIDTLATNGVLKLNGVAVTLGQEISIADINAGKLQFVPDANENGAPYGSFTFSVKDSSGAFDLVPNTLTLNVTAVPDTPTGADVTKTTNEDTPYVIGKADFGFADVDGDTFKAVRVDTLPTNGTLTLNGVLVTAGQVITVADLDAGKLRFVPDADENGTPYGSFTFSVQDSTNAFDAAPNTFTLNVTPVADTPEGTDATKTTAEDTPYVVTAADFGFKDVDGDTFAAVRIDTLATNGVLKLNGVAVTLGQEISIADINAGKLQFVPDANENGAPYGSFTFSVKDSSGAFDLVPNTLTLNVTAVPDTPTGADVTKTTNEDTPYVIGKADFGFADVDGDTFKAVRVDTLPTNGTLTLNGVLVTAGQVITVADLDAGKLRFVPDADENGTPYGSFTFSVQDSTNAFDAAPNTFTLNVTPVADTPEGTDATKTTAEDTPYVVTAADFGFKDVDGDTFAGVRIDTLATNGVLKLNGVAVTLGQEISIADINAGKLQFVPDANENGAPYGSFTFSVKDSSGAFDLVPNTLTLNVTAVPDTPTGADVTKTTNEDTPYVIGKADFGFADVDGDTFKAVRVDTLPTNGTLTLNGVLVTAGQIITVADLDAGKLRFVPDANENGTPYGSFTFSVQDSSNAFDLVPNTFTLNVTSLPDTPDSQDVTRTTNEDVNYIVKLADFAYADGDGDAFASVVISSLPTNGQLLFNGLAVTVGQTINTADITAGKLVFAPDLHESGTNYATFTFQVKDSTGALDATPNTFTMNVTAVPDAPTLAVGAKSFSIAENFESVNLGGTYFKNIDPTTLTGGIWRTDNKAVGTNPKSVEIAEFANTTWYGATSNGTNGTRAIELEQNPGDRSNLFTEIAVEKGEVFSFSFDAAARLRNNGADITNKTSVFYVYWEGQLVYTFNSLSGTFTNFQMDLVATQTGNARLEFIAGDSDSFGAMVDNIKVDLRQNTGVQGYVVNVPDLTAGLVDKDGSETLALRVEAIPVGAVLTDGVNSFTSAAGATTATITGWDLTKISLLPPAAFSGTIDLTVVATATEASNNTSVSTSKQVQLTVLADANNQYGAAADDTLAGTANADRLWGFEGNDRLSGAAGNDTVIGGAGNDTLAGDDGNDLLDGSAGTDSLAGGLGIDTLQGGIGNDTLTGNDGNDVFRWSLGDGGTAGAPTRDVITDFSTSAVGGDILDLRDLLQGEEVNVTTNLHNYIDIDTTSVAGQTIIRISTTGGFTNGVYDASKEDQSITLSNINLRAALGRPNGTDLELLTDLFARKQLIIDGV
ncbi:Ig-like domain-containing protein [Ideonella paludis]|uniref:Ig-like domain-containing protein n=1 Tax=Ideonella paludis TaxID=1233411 RepID=UPI0036264D04